MCLHICLCVFATIRVNAGADTEDWWKRIFVKQIRSCTQKLYRLFPLSSTHTIKIAVVVFEFVKVFRTSCDRLKWWHYVVLFKYSRLSYPFCLLSNYLNGFWYKSKRIWRVRKLWEIRHKSRPCLQTMPCKCLYM